MAKKKVKKQDWEIIDTPKSQWEIMEERDDLPIAQNGTKTKKVEYTDKDKYLKAKQAFDDSSAYYKYYQLQKQNEFENKPDFFERFMGLADKIVWQPIEYLSGVISPEQKKKEQESWAGAMKTNFDFYREMDIARAKGDTTLAKQIVHKYGFDDSPSRKTIWENVARKPFLESRYNNIKELWDSNSFDKSPYKNFEDFKQKQETLWNYGDSLIAANPNFRWSNNVNSPDLVHRNIQPTGQWRGLAYNRSMMIPPSTEPVYKETKSQVNTDQPNKKVSDKPITKPTPVVTAPPDTIKVPQYSKIVNGQRVTISKEEYDKMTKGQQSTPTGNVVKQDGKVIQFKQKGGIINQSQWEIIESGGLPTAQDGKKVNIIDPRTVDQWGNPMKNSQRKDIKNVSPEMLKMLVKSSIDKNIDPNTTLAIALQETGLGTQSLYGKKGADYNPLHYNYIGNRDVPLTKQEVIDESVNFLKSKYADARKLGKVGDADSIQSWNGYGTVSGFSKPMYGIPKEQLEYDLVQPDGDASAPWDQKAYKIDMRKNPVYGKTIVNLRDSVIKQNPEIQKIVNEYKNPKPYIQKAPLPGQSVPTMDFQTGGKIKTDPKGYWNKDNHGKPVRIRSKFIDTGANPETGEPLEVPFIAVSNTGDGRILFPNTGIHQFDGSYVTEYPLPEAGSGYTVKRSNARKGKTHVVIGPDGTKKYFGDSKLGQHPKDPARKKAFYARHKKNLANNPYFRAFARKTWEEGGMLPDLNEMAFGGLPKAQDGLYNMKRALELNYKPDETGHWPSVDSETGMWLKSKEHPTAWMEYLYGYALNPEVQKQFKHPVVNPEGYFGEDQLQYIPKQAFGGNIMLEKYANGGNVWEILPEAQTGTQMGYSWSTQQAPIKLAGSVEHPQTKNYNVKTTEDYFKLKAITNPAYNIIDSRGIPTEEGLGNDIISSGIGMVAMPASLPIKATTTLGKIGVEALNMLNPFGGFKGTPKQLPGSGNVAPQQMGFINTKGAFQKYPKGKLTQEEIDAFKNSDYYKQTTKEHLDAVNKYGDSWNLPNYAEENLQEAILTGDRSRINPVLYGGRNWGTSDYVIAGLAGTAYPGYAGITGLAFSPPAVKNKVLNSAGITSKPGVLSSQDTTINITNRPMDFAKVNETADGQVIIGGEFIEGSNNTVRKAKDWLTATDTYSDKEYPSKDIQSFYGIEDGKFKVGKASDFKPNTEIVPRRFGATNISQAILNEGAMRLLDDKGNPIYQNTPNTGKFILYSPSTKEAEFNYINTGKSGVDKINKFLKKNKDAQYIHLDNGRYEFYGLNPEGLSGQDFRDYYQQDLQREGNPGYNMIIKKNGGIITPPAAIIGAGALQEQKFGGKTKWEILPENEWEIIE